MKRSRLNAFINAIRAIRSTVDDTTALTVPDLYAEWSEGTDYTADDRILYEGTLYKCLQSHTAQADWIPTNAPSLWARVLIPDPDVIPDWVQPDSTNPYMKGDKVRYDGKVWISIVDNNVWAPGTFGWEVCDE